MAITLGKRHFAFVVELVSFTKNPFSNYQGSQRLRLSDLTNSLTHRTAMEGRNASYAVVKTRQTPERSPKLVARSPGLSIPEQEASRKMLDRHGANAPWIRNADKFSLCCSSCATARRFFWPDRKVQYIHMCFFLRSHVRDIHLPRI